MSVNGRGDPDSGPGNVTKLRSAMNGCLLLFTISLSLYIQCPSSHYKLSGGSHVPSLPVKTNNKNPVSGL